VITEGILTRRLQRDPGLDGISAVIFDEYHERSIHADLGLALCLDVQAGLREDLRLIAMSATLDGEAVAAIMGNAPVLRSEGRSYPVETRWLESPWKRPNGPRNGFETAMAATIERAMAEESGDALVFLPGVGEIERVRRLLDNEAHDVRVIHGSLPFARQRAALAPAQGGQRRIVLATAIAETSLTIDGVRIVVDGGLSRRALFDAGAGMTRLVTRRVSRASADQRRGRAGRTEPGVCYRLWTKGEEGGFALADPPEIAEADLAPLILDLAVWGIDDPAGLQWLDTPPPAACDQARQLFASLGALDDGGRPTDHGRQIAELPLHPRLAHLMVEAREADSGRRAADLAAVLEEKDPLSGAGADLSLRLDAVKGTRRDADRAALARIRETAKRLAGGAADKTPLSVGSLVALAYPDRVAMRRPGTAPRYVMTGGKGAVFHSEGDSLAGQPFLAIAHLDGNPREAKIRLAASLTRAEVDDLFDGRIEERRHCVWNPRTRTVDARVQLCLDALVLEDRPWKSADGEAIAAAAAEGVRALGLACLPWAGDAERLRARVRWAREYGGQDMPDCSDAALLDTLEEWLTPHLAGVRKEADFAALDLAQILRNGLDWPAQQALDRLAPAALTTPAGTKAKIDYAQDPPALEVRIQEMFGETRHPAICDGKVPLLIRLLSPARRPVQVTGDLPGFWANSYADVRKDMRGRYPRHPWPENPLEATPTNRVKPRGR
jgi:ATP-dependent helicase HrpB